MKKEDIISEVRRAAGENGGKPLGQSRFEEATGINQYVWLKYWSRFGDLQKAAGFEPNQLNSAYDEPYLIEKIISLARELGKFPTPNERRTKAFNDPNFPSSSTFDRLGNKERFLSKILTYCQEKEEYSDIVKLITPLINKEENRLADVRDVSTFGFVYLVKGHPGEYKIGRTNIVDRRLSELGATASIEQELVHEIKTDDPVGVEAYWHRRLQDKRMRGEWFKLIPADVRAFKRWKRIF
jgi:hypothetical protein